MKRWGELAAERPELAEVGRAMIYQFRVGLGYLATIRKDGGPRVHPVCPVIANGGLYVFIGNHSPKRYDLLRDGRFALHSFPNPEVDDEFTVSGRARRIDDAAVRQIVYDAYTATGATTSDDTLFELWPSALARNDPLSLAKIDPPLSVLARANVRATFA
jgi:Pyridoxamine 5'-phosphate oxidase